jgi:Arc/MetJ-type ribon-helix-helix transcriptional regulator
MSAEPVHAEEQEGHLQEMARLAHALGTRPPAELARLLTSCSGLLEDDVRRRAVEAIVAIQIAGRPQLASELVHLLESERYGTTVQALDVFAEHMRAELKHAGTARKVSVSMPADLTAAVQQRVGRGKFSQYVTEAVTRQLELDLLAELSELLTAEHGPVPEEYLAEARAAWPDSE